MKPVTSLSVVVELVTPTVAVVAVFLLASGHDRPGGGFVAGLVFAAIPAIRHAAGLPVVGARWATSLLGAGVVVAGSVAALGIVTGDPLLTQYAGNLEIPLFGSVKLSTILVFDMGVAAVVVGVVLAVVTHLDDDPADRRRAPERNA